jgi:phosphate/sulfate permease
MAGGTMAGAAHHQDYGSAYHQAHFVGGFAAETAGAITLYATARLGIPVSTTHALLGVGASPQLKLSAGT